jgi:hypothetical protein
MNEQEPASGRPEKKANGHSRKSLVVGLLVGMVAGAILLGGAIVAATPSMMIVTEESQLGFDETVAALEKSVEGHGWVVSTVMDKKVVKDERAMLSGIVRH